MWSVDLSKSSKSHRVTWMGTPTEGTSHYGTKVLSLGLPTTPFVYTLTSLGSVPSPTDKFKSNWFNYIYNPITISIKSDNSSLNVYTFPSFEFVLRTLWPNLDFFNQTSLPKGNYVYICIYRCSHTYIDTHTIKGTETGDSPGLGSRWGSRHSWIVGLERNVYNKGWL